MLHIKICRNWLMNFEIWWIANYKVGRFLWVLKTWHVFRKSGIPFKYVFWEGNLVHPHWLVYQIVSSFLARTTQYNQTKPERNGLKCRKVLMEAEGLGKDLESRTLSKTSVGGLAWWEIFGQPQARREAWWGSGWRGIEKWGNQTLQKLKAASSTVFAQDFSTVSGCKLNCLEARSEVGL